MSSEEDAGRVRRCFKHGGGTGEAEHGMAWYGMDGMPWYAMGSMDAMPWHGWYILMAWHGWCILMAWHGTPRLGWHDMAWYGMDAMAWHG